MSSSIQEVHFDGTSRCRVVLAGSRRTYFSTPQAVGLALLHTTHDEEVATNDIVWSDYLCTHGVAVGKRGQRVLHLATIPIGQRSVNYISRNERTGAEERTTLNVTFPPILMGLVLNTGRFERGIVFMVKPDMTAAGVTSQAPLLTPFPYGNIHAPSGHICWGGVATADIRSIHDLEALFLGSGFNRDLVLGGSMGGFGSIKTAVEAAPGGVLPPIPVGAFTRTFPHAIQALLGEG